MRDDENELDIIAGKVMAAVMSTVDSDGQSVGERMLVSDLWMVIQTTTTVVHGHILMSKGSRDYPSGLTAEEVKVWTSSLIRDEIRTGRKIQAIKEARMLTSMGLKEAKDLVERMEATYKASGGTRWLL